jgi:hypothetical protein
LTDFHTGTWKGIAKSFAISDDIAAGIIQRQTTEYTVSVAFSSNGDNLVETFFPEPNDDNTIPTSKRQIPITKTGTTDVDSVDGSYSLDFTLPDLPSDITGTEQLITFGIEHCIAEADTRRARCWMLYGPDQQKLARIVVCQEERIQQQRDDNEEDTRNNRDQNEPSLNSSILSNRINDSSTATTPLSRYDIRLLELSAGVWLGDAIIRDVPFVVSSPLEKQSQRSMDDLSKKGFGKLSPSPSQSSSYLPRFGAWSVGVQKVAWRWMWNFGDEIRQVVDWGKAMGAEAFQPYITSMKSLAGTVCVNEGLSRRIRKHDRMVYVDWDGDNVGFLLGSYVIQVPRYLRFDEGTGNDATRRIRPFYTEFSVFQSAATRIDTTDSENLPEVVCSKISRVYNYEGKLKQGITSFFNLQRFVNEEENEGGDDEDDDLLLDEFM